MRWARIAVVAALANGCATGYQPAGATGGYSERQINARSWEISASGNGYTSPAAVREMSLRRASEIALWTGYPFFVVNAANSDASYSAWSTPVNCAGANCYGGTAALAQRPGASIVVTMLAEGERAPRGAVVYDAMLYLLQSGAKRYPDGTPVISAPVAGYPKPLPRQVASR